MSNQRRVMTSADLAAMPVWARDDSLRARDALAEFIEALEENGTARVLVTNGVQRTLIVDPARVETALGRASGYGLLVESTTRLTAVLHASPTSRLEMMLAVVPSVDVASCVARVLADIALLFALDPGPSSGTSGFGSATAALRAAAGVQLVDGRLVPDAMPASDSQAWWHQGVAARLQSEVPRMLLDGEFAAPLPPATPLVDTLTRLLVDVADWKVVPRWGSPLALRPIVALACEHVGLLATAAALSAPGESRLRLARGAEPDPAASRSVER